MTQVRLQKFLAECGTGSRRKMEQFITEGRVRVNGQVVTELGRKIDPSVDQVEVNRKPVRPAPKGIVLLNKPRGVVSTLSDPEGRRTISEFLTKNYSSYFPVGRLDFDSTGLIILTNDGEMGEKLMHPRFGFERSYEARVEGSVSQSDLDRLPDGIRLSDGLVHAHADVIRSDDTSTWIEVRIKEGRNRIVRRLFEKIGHSVMKLKRTMYGPFKLGRLQVGQVRVLTAREFLDVRYKVMTFKGEEGPKVEKGARKKISARPEGRLSDFEREHPRHEPTADSRRHPGRGDSEGLLKPRSELDKPRAKRPRSDEARSDRPRSDRPRFDRERSEKPRSEKPRSDRPRMENPRADKPRFEKPRTDKPRSDKPRSDKPRFDKPRSDRPRSDRPRSDRPRSDKPRSDRPRFDKPRSDKPRSDRPRFDKPRSDKPRSDKPRTRTSQPENFRSKKPRSDNSRSDRPRSDRPSRDKPGSEGRPRTGGSRPAQSRFKGGGRPSGGKRGGRSGRAE